MLTHEEAFNQQVKELQAWKKILTKEAYMQLEHAVVEQNHPVPISPYDICRGDAITKLVIELFIN